MSAQSSKTFKKGESVIIIDGDLSTEIVGHLSGENLFIISDSNVAKLYEKVFIAHYVIAAGEDSKTLETVENICVHMLEKGCNRDTVIVAIGGGVVGDIAGFAAAIFMRGINWINMPTSLLAQVDSSVGGKTGVDLHDYKNIIGAFHLPVEVVISMHWLKTLNEREWLCGVGEIFKTALLDKNIFEYICGNADKLLQRHQTVYSKLICDCIAFKEGIVKKDMYEGGLRKILNVGHTVGHAVEMLDGHRLSHGEYVILGMIIESYICKNHIEKKYYAKVSELLSKVKINLDIKFSALEIAEAAKKDKKNCDGKISIMVSVASGQVKEFKLGGDEVVKGIDEWKLNR